MILEEMIIEDEINENEVREMFERHIGKAESITLTYHLNDYLIVDAVEEQKLLSLIVAEIYGMDFQVMAPIIIGEEIGNINRKIVIDIHDIVTELQWKE